MFSRSITRRHLIARHWRPATQQPQIQAHVQVHFQFQPCKKLSSASKNFADYSDRQTNESREVRRILASFLTLPGSEIDHGEIIKKLPQLPSDNHLHLDSAFFLVTPSLAKLFEQGSAFHASVINHIFGQTSTRLPPQSLVAVVDAIPNPKNPINQHAPVEDGEGIAVCISNRIKTVEANAEKSNDASELPHINFSLSNNPFADVVTLSSFLAPAANTLFINGREHTITRSDWKQQSEGVWVEDPLSYRQLDRIHFPINETLSKSFRHGARIGSPLEILTEPARVISSMGNIIREIQNSSGTSMSASEELEEIVPKLLKERQKDGEDGDLRVFALVYPASQKRLESDIFRNLLKPQKAGDQLLSHKYIDTSMLMGILKFRGRLHRVTSGGAGWGKRAGLLSLEPKTDARQRLVPEPDMPEFFFGDGRVTMPDAQQLIPRDSMVQFLATYIRQSSTPKSFSSLSQNLETVEGANFEEGMTNPWFNGDLVQTICIGTSVAADPVETDSQMIENQDATEISLPSPSLIFLPNRFGVSSVLPIGMTFTNLSDSRSSGDIEPGTTNSSTTVSNSHVSISATAIHSTLVEPPGTAFAISSYADEHRVWDKTALVKRQPRPQIMLPKQNIHVPLNSSHDSKLDLRNDGRSGPIEGETQVPAKLKSIQHMELALSICESKILECHVIMAELDIHSTLTRTFTRVNRAISTLHKLSQDLSRLTIPLVDSTVQKHHVQERPSRLLQRPVTHRSPRRGRIRQVRTTAAPLLWDDQHRNPHSDDRNRSEGQETPARYVEYTQREISETQKDVGDVDAGDVPSDSISPQAPVSNPEKSESISVSLYGQVTGVKPEKAAVNSLMEGLEEDRG